MKSQLQVQLGQKIKHLRKVKGYSQELFAEKIGVATNTLSSIERGLAFMTAQTLENIIRVLDISAEELFSFSEESANEKMYNFIINRLEFIKEDNYRLNILYSVAKGLC